MRFTQHRLPVLFAWPTILGWLLVAPLASAQSSPPSPEPPAATATATATTAPTGQKVIYKCKAADGSNLFSDTPCDNVEKTISVEDLKAKSAATPK